MDEIDVLVLAGLIILVGVTVAVGVRWLGRHIDAAITVERNLTRTRLDEMDRLRMTVTTEVLNAISRCGALTAETVRQLLDMHTDTVVAEINDAAASIINEIATTRRQESDTRDLLMAQNRTNSGDLAAIRRHGETIGTSVDVIRRNLIHQINELQRGGASVPVDAVTTILAAATKLVYPEPATPPWTGPTIGTTDDVHGNPEPDPDDPEAFAGTELDDHAADALEMLKRWQDGEDVTTREEGWSETDDGPADGGAGFAIGMETDGGL